MNKPIYLTFDDGPLEPYFSEALTILDEFQAKATFFVCGASIERHPELARRIIQAGHTIGNHTFSHNWSKTLSGDLIDEVNQTNELIKRYTGIDTRLYRSPWGITRSALRRTLLKKHFQIYHWNIMAFDWWQPSPEFIARHVIHRAFPGAIVLLHIGDRAGTGDRKNTVAALPKILKELQKQGYQFCALDSGYNNRQAGWKNIVKDILLASIGR